MKKWGIVIGILVTLLFTSVSHAGNLFDPKWMDDWDTADRLLLATYSGFWFIDYGQTRTIALNPERWHEKNRILGPHPSVGSVNAYFLGYYVFNLYVSNHLGEIQPALGFDWGSILRKAYLAAFIYEHARCAKQNKDLGISISFDLFRF